MNTAKDRPTDRRTQKLLAERLERQAEHEIEDLLRLRREGKLTLLQEARLQKILKEDHDLAKKVLESMNGKESES